MSRRPIDTKTEYQGSKDLPPTREIEDPQHYPVPECDPPTITIKREPYLANEELRKAVNLAIALGRPLLLQGDPGCGKTRLAYAVAYELSLPLEACYVKSTSRAQDFLYTYNAIKRLYDAQLKDEKSRDFQEYIRLEPLGRAIARAQHKRRSVVLIDEIDKADLDFPNDLLLELDRFEFEVTEDRSMHYAIPPDNPEFRPIVFITHNEEKALPSAFLRRCIYHYVKFPEDDGFLQAVLAFHEATNKDLGIRAITVLKKLRKLDLNKRPGLSELIDWVRYMEAVKTPTDELDKLPYIGVLLKQLSDQQRAQKELG